MKIKITVVFQEGSWGLIRKLPHIFWIGHFRYPCGSIIVISNRWASLRHFHLDQRRVVFFIDQSISYLMIVIVTDLTLSSNRRIPSLIKWWGKSCFYMIGWINIVNWDLSHIAATSFDRHRLLRCAARCVSCFGFKVEISKVTGRSVCSWAWSYSFWILSSSLRCTKSSSFDCVEIGNELETIILIYLAWWFIIARSRAWIEFQTSEPLCWTERRGFWVAKNYYFLKFSY